MEGHTRCVSSASAQNRTERGLLTFLQKTTELYLNIIL